MTKFVVLKKYFGYDTFRSGQAFPDICGLALGGGVYINNS